MTTSIHSYAPLRLPGTMLRNLSAVAMVGAAIAVVGVFTVPERAWPNILLAAYYFVSLGLAAVLFIALQYVSNAGWSVGIRRVPEAMTGVLPVGGALVLLCLFGIHTLYEWSHDAVVAGDPILSSKSGWLNVPFFVVRTLFYLMVWFAFASVLVKNSRRQDENGDLDAVQRNKKISAAFIIVFALTFTAASMDWIMSLEPHWYSTIFGIYNFSGMFLNGLAALTILVILLRRMGPLAKVVTEAHLHDLGKLVFAFSTFWMYIWFSQYILIWYANIPEEVVYYIRRERGSWAIFTIVNVLFNWVVPFLALLPIWTKRNEGVLLRVCMIVMIGHWIDLYWMILPPFMQAEPLLSIWEIAPIAAAVAAFFIITLRSFAKHRPVPVNDPLLVESLAQHH